MQQKSLEILDSVMTCCAVKRLGTRVLTAHVGS